MPVPNPVSPNRKVGKVATTDLFATSIRLQVFTTRPTTGLVKGDFFLLFHGSTPKLGVCTSQAAQTIKMVRLRTKTFGRLTA